MVWLRSKITAPRTTLEAVGRPRLVDSLHYNNLRKLTVVRAPAGYGKTTLLSQMISQLDEPVAWLSLDANDNEPVRFWNYVMRAVSNATIKNTDSKIMPQFNEQSPLELLIDSFLNEIALIRGSILIVIDDYHLIESSVIHTMMLRFIDHLPDNIRLLIASRTDLPLPFAKWRVQESLTEIGVEQLRFTYEETELFYSKRKFSYEDTESLQRLVQMTEGWAAGIQLAGLSGGITAADNSPVNQFNSKYPFITEYLLQEILASLSPSEQDFLLRTSILKHLEPVICDALTNRTDSYTILLELERKGLFIVRLHSGEPIFRYHHLFQDALKIELQNRYSQDAIASFYEKVARILLDRGDIVLAIELTLRGKLWSLADQCITTYLVDIFTMGHVSTFIRWIEVLRSNHYMVHVESLVMYMIALSNEYEIEKAKRLVDELEYRNEDDHWMQMDEYLGVASIFITAKAFVIFASGGDVEQAKALISTQITNGRASSRWDHIPMQYNQLQARTLRTPIGVRGKLWPKEVVMPFLELFRQSEFKEQNMTGFGYAVQAETLYEHDDIEEAFMELEVALQYGHRFQDPGLYTPMYILKARIYAMRKNYLEAHSILDYAMEITKEHHWIDMLRVMKAHCYLHEGNVSQAEWELSKSTGVYHMQAESEQPFWLLAHVRLLLAKGQAEEALKATIRIKEKALRDRQVVTIIEAGVLEAICQMKLLNESAGMAALHGALKQGEPYQYKRTFLDDESIEPLLKKYLKVRQKGTHAQGDSVSTPYIEQLIRKYPRGHVLDSLKPRERDILKLLAEGCSNSEIATRLNLSEGTVRVYLTNMYSKLGVNSRTKAVLIAMDE